MLAGVDAVLLEEVVADAALLTRVVAAVNAAEAFGAELLPELVEEVDALEEVLEVDEVEVVLEPPRP